MSEPNLLSNDPSEDIAPVSPFGAIDYGVTPEELLALAKEFGDITEITSRKEADKAQAALTRLIRARTSIETRRKQLKAESLEFGRLVDSTAKELQSVTEPEETRLRELVDADKARREAEKAEREAKEKARVDEITDRIQGIVLLPGTLQRASSDEVLAARDKLEALVIDDTFAEFQDQAIEAHTAVIEQLNELYAGALHDEKLEREAQERREREDAERKAEDERLAKERKELEAKQAEIDAENERKAKELADQQAAIEAEKQAIEDAKRKEAERIERERLAKEKEETEAKAEQERKERAERLRPDKEKIIAFADQLNFVVPAVESDEAKELMVSSITQIKELRQWITSRAHKL